MSETIDIPASEERRLDAVEIEKLIQQEGLVTRPSVKAHLESLVQKIKRDSLALKRMEDSSAKAENSTPNDASDAKPAAKTSTTTPTPAPIPATTPTPPPPTTPSMKYKSIDKFSFDAGSYNSPTVTIYIFLPSIGTARETIQTNFTSTSFDLTVHDFNGVNYRLFKDNLANEIEAEKSKCVVKADKIVLKLRKKKGEYGSYDSWNELTSTKTKDDRTKKNKDPTAGIMDMMKDMYDKGDDKMKKMIGETMMKQREGNLGKPGAGGDDMGMPDF